MQKKTKYEKIPLKYAKYAFRPEICKIQGGPFKKVDSF